MRPVSAPADKRFRRAHVKPSSRRRSRLHGAWIAARIVCMVAAFGYGAWRGASWMSGTSALRVAHVTVSGNDRLSTGEVLSLVDGLNGRNILGLDLAEWQDRLLASPWVEDATLRRVLPGTVDVTIRERRPIAIGRVDQALYLVDAHGVVVDEYGPSYADLDLPMVDGLGGRGQARGTIDEARVKLAGRVLASLGSHPELIGKVSLVDVSRAHDAVVMLEGDTAMLHLGEEQFAERLQ
jgi:cell division protein FtsQ